MTSQTTTHDVILNGKTLTIEAGTTIGKLLDTREIERRMVAVELNGEIIPRYDFDSTTIEAGDRLELLQMVGGGL